MNTKNKTDIEATLKTKTLNETYLQGDWNYTFPLEKSTI